MREYDINPGFIGHEFVDPTRQRSCAHIPVRVFEDQSGEGFHVNTSWTIPFSHSVSVQEIGVFEACAVVNK